MLHYTSHCEKEEKARKKARKIEVEACFFVQYKATEKCNMVGSPPPPPESLVRC
jgi:hypothetical protein